MNQNVMTLIIVVGVLVIYSGIVEIAKKLKEKKIDTESMLKTADTGLGYAQSDRKSVV